MPHLIVNVPGEEPHRLELVQDVVVGRVAPADVIVADAKVSRCHCTFVKQATGWSVKDLGSSNGTRVSGRVVKTHPLRHGDRVEIGRTVLVFEAAAAKRFDAPVRASARERLASRRRRR